VVGFVGVQYGRIVPGLGYLQCREEAVLLTPQVKGLDNVHFKNHFLTHSAAANISWHQV
jgi:hypothetical protein